MNQYPQVHDLTIVGEVRNIAVSTPRDPKKGASAQVLVQWGAERQTSGGAVDFINAGIVRIPSYRWPKLADRMKVGQMVKISGHLQGVVKNVQTIGRDVQQVITTELVADTVRILSQLEGDDTAGAPEADAPAEA